MTGIEQTLIGIGAAQLLGTLVTLAAATRDVANNRERIATLESDLKDMHRILADKYVPRSEVTTALDGIRNIAANTNSMMEAYLSGRAQTLGSVKASEETTMTDAPSLSRLALVHPVLSRKVQAAAAALAQQGIYFRVAPGLRTYAEQDALYALGRTKPGYIVTNARGGYSNHNFGCAVDCYPFVEGSSGEIDFDQLSPRFRAMVAALRAQGLVWGGSWDSIPDAPHFQLAHVPVTPTGEDRAAFAAGGIHAVWARYPEIA